MNTIDHEAKVAQLKEEIDRDQVARVQAVAEYNALAYDAECGDDQAKERLVAARKRVKLLSDGIERKQAALQAAAVLAERSVEVGLGTRRRDDFLTARKLIGERHALAERLHAELEAVALTARALAALGDQAVDTAAPHLGTEMVYAVAPTNLAPYILRRLIMLAGFEDSPGVVVPPTLSGSVPSIVEIAKQDGARLECRCAVEEAAA